MTLGERAMGFEPIIKWSERLSDHVLASVEGFYD